MAERRIGIIQTSYLHHSWIYIIGHDNTNRVFFECLFFSQQTKIWEVLLKAQLLLLLLIAPYLSFLGCSVSSAHRVTSGVIN